MFRARRQVINPLIALIGILAAVWIVGYGYEASRLARDRRRPPLRWFVYGGVLGPLGIRILRLAPPGRCNTCLDPVVGWSIWCSYCGCDSRENWDRPTLGRRQVRGAGTTLAAVDRLRRADAPAGSVPPPIGVPAAASGARSRRTATSSSGRNAAGKTAASKTAPSKTAASKTAAGKAAASKTAAGKAAAPSSGGNGTGRTATGRTAAGKAAASSSGGNGTGRTAAGKTAAGKAAASSSGGNGTGRTAAGKSGPAGRNGTGRTAAGRNGTSRQGRAATGSGQLHLASAVFVEGSIPLERGTRYQLAVYGDDLRIMGTASSLPGGRILSRRLREVQMTSTAERLVVTGTSERLAEFRLVFNDVRNGTVRELPGDLAVPSPVLGEEASFKADASGVSP